VTILCTFVSDFGFILSYVVNRIQHVIQCSWNFQSNVRLLSKNNISVTTGESSAVSASQLQMPIDCYVNILSVGGTLAQKQGGGVAEEPDQWATKSGWRECISAPFCANGDKLKHELILVLVLSKKAT
jgi:hypothetical protein